MIQVEKEPLYEISLHEELDIAEWSLKYKKYIDKLQSYIKRLKRFHKICMWFYRGVSILCLSGIIYCTIELYGCQNT